MAASPGRSNSLGELVSTWEDLLSKCELDGLPEARENLSAQRENEQNQVAYSSRPLQKHRLSEQFSENGRSKCGNHSHIASVLKINAERLVPISQSTLQVNKDMKETEQSHQWATKQALPDDQESCHLSTLLHILQSFPFSRSPLKVSNASGQAMGQDCDDGQDARDARSQGSSSPSNRELSTSTQYTSLKKGFFGSVDRLENPHQEAPLIEVPSANETRMVDRNKNGGKAYYGGRQKRRRHIRADEHQQSKGGVSEKTCSELDFQSQASETC